MLDRSALKLYFLSRLFLTTCRRCAPSTAVVASSPKLLNRVRWHLRTKHYSIRTEHAYVDWIKRFILYHNKRHPLEMAEEEVARFLTYLARDRDALRGAALMAA